ncbi:MAG: glycosyltransferase family 2 protein [Candidatus Anstonellaceae archaeon]
MTEIILSICIPTFQRKNELKRTIDALLPLIEKNSEIEICVSDNGSSDGTYELLKNYANKYPKNFRIRRNKKNLGYDINYYKVAKMAKGKYIWVIGDDDLPQTKNIFDMINKIKKADYGLVIANGGDIKSIENLKKDFKKEEYLQDQFIRLYKDYLKRRNSGEVLNGFMSCFLYKKAFIKGILKNKKYFGWIHYALFLKILTDKKIGKILVYRNPLIIVPIQDGTKIFFPYQLDEVFIENKLKALREIKIKDYQRIDEIIQNHKKQMYFKILVASIIGKDFFEKKINEKNEKVIKNIEKILGKSNEISSKFLLIFGKFFFELNKITFLRKLIIFIASIHPKIRKYRKLSELYFHKKIEDEKTRTKY